MMENRVEILDNKKVTKNFYVMRFSWPFDIPLPGQFINLKVPGKFLKRPFTVFDYEKGQLCILYKVVGEGTGYMTSWERGFKTTCLGPLGKPFVIDDNVKILIGGGTGIASLYYFSKTLKDAYVFLGFSSGDEAYFFYNIFSKFSSNVFVSSIDGSYGFKGNVVDLFMSKMDFINGKKTIYSCGPKPMLSNLKKFSNTNNVEKIWVSLEERMGCGFGACLGCAVETKDNSFLYVCKDGPAFLIEDILI